MENLCILYFKRTTIFQKLFQQDTELQEKLAALNHHTHIPTQELPGGLSFKIAFMHQKNPISLLCASSMMSTSVSRQTASLPAARSLKTREKNQRRLRSTCAQNFGLHFLYNYLMDYYQNKAIVKAQYNSLKPYLKPGQSISRDKFHRFIIISNN